MAKRKRAGQAPKDTGNRRYIDAMLELRRSNAAQPHRNKKAYDRPRAGARGRDW